MAYYICVAVDVPPTSLRACAGDCTVAKTRNVHVETWRRHPLGVHLVANPAINAAGRAVPPADNIDQPAADYPESVHQHSQVGCLVIRR